MRRVAPWIVLGVVVGILTAKASSGTFLKWVWVVAAGLVSLKMALGREDWRISDELPPRPWPELAAGVIGFISTLMSIGGATFVVPLLTLYGRPILSAVATASGIGPLIALPGVIGFAWAGWAEPGLPPLSVGFVNLVGMVIVAPLSVYAAPYGVRLAHNIPRRWLELRVRRVPRLGLDPLLDRPAGLERQAALGAASRGRDVAHHARTRRCWPSITPMSHTVSVSANGSTMRRPE